MDPAAMPKPPNDAHSDRAHQTPRGFENGRKTALTTFVFGGIWFLLFRVLAAHWSVSPQYRYGWLVPILALYALAGRWKTRPPPSAKSPAGPWLAAIAALAFLPTWLLLQPNPDWRTLSWMLTAEVVSITAAAFMYAGGPAWAKHFAIPICLIFTAVPWPRPWEIPLIERLTHSVTRVSIELLNLAGVRSVQQGNMIELRTGLLGVEEACSGIRSLQATLMIALFLGEVFRFNLRQRALLVLLGAATAFATNVVRTCFLAWIADDRGIDAVSAWHDRAADVALIACFAAVWIFSTLIGRNGEAITRLPQTQKAHPLPANLLRGLAAWFIAALIVTELWFYDPAKDLATRWQLVPPPSSKPVALSAIVMDQLQFDRGSAATWNEPGGKQWLLYYFEWKPGPPRSRLLARSHHPQNCLSAAGMKMLVNRGTIMANIDGFQLRFQAFTFESEGRTLFVYHCVHENRAARAEQYGELDPSILLASLQAVAWRERNLGQQVAELAAFGYPSAAEADAALMRNLRTLINSTPER